MISPRIVLLDSGEKDQKNIRIRLHPYSSILFTWPLMMISNVELEMCITTLPKVAQYLLDVL